jgi:hypothetical protein
MLYLNPPYYIIDGVSIFPDDSDPLQFYFLPMMPRLTTTKDVATGKDVPVIQLIEYEGSAGTGGFINFDVNIGIDPDVLDDVTAKLKRQAQLSDTPRLSPLTFVDGTVKLLILGAQSPDPAAPTTSGKPPAPTPPGTDGGPKFVVKIENAVKPALDGNNQASFSVQLDQYGATILEQALKGEMVPIAVIYSLEFLALRPAFHVHLHVDWDRVQSYLDDQCSGGVLFFSTDIESMVQKLIENQVITIEVDSFVADGEADSHDVSSEEGRATAEVYEMVKKNFFESSLPPDPTQPDDWTRAEGTFDKISQMVVTGGAASLASFSYKKVDLTRIDKKSLDVNISERTAVLRTIYPQGHLSGLLSILQDGQEDIDRFILRVNLDNPWFQRRRVNVISHANFAADSIASIDVNLNYNGLVQSVTLTGDGTGIPVEWNSVLVNGQMQRPVSYTYTINFKNVDTTQRPGQLTSSEKISIGDVIDIEPRNDLYGITMVPIRADSFPWNRYPNVEVECRYADSANNIDLEASAILSSSSPEVEWPLFLCDLTHRSFDYRLTFSLATGGTAVTPWTTTDAGKIDIFDPYPAKITLNIVPALDWTVFDQALVYVAYPDQDSPLAQQTYIFNKTSAAIQTFIVDRRDASANLIYYEVRLIKRNGEVWSVPGSFTGDKYLMLQNDMKGHRIITARSEPIDFAAKHVSEIDVQVRYIDDRNSLNFVSRFTLWNNTDIQTFSYDFVDDQIQPEYRADIQLDNGQATTIDWAPINGRTLAIQLSQLD